MMILVNVILLVMAMTATAGIWLTANQLCDIAIQLKRVAEQLERNSGQSP